MSEKNIFTTINDLERYIEDLMGSEGSSKSAKKLTKLLIEKDFFELEWDGYFSTDKWGDVDDDEFFGLWEEIEGEGK